VRIALAGTPHVAVPALEWLSNSEHELVRVFTTSSKPSGRGGRLIKSDVALWCDANGVECVEISEVQGFEGYLMDLDCVVVIAFGILLPQHILDQPRHGFINLHFSELPRWRGAAPVQRAIENGDSCLGITVFSLDAGMDTGPIYQHASFKRDHQMRSAEALDFLAQHGVPLISDSLRDISSGISPIAQSLEGSSIATKISKSEAQIDWFSSVDAIHRKILAFYPSPIAHTLFRGDTLKVTMSIISDGSVDSLSPGEIHVTKNSLFVGASGGVLEILSLIPQGKGEMKAADWARGARIDSGERFG
jgi:methionyl-tRNA formyltransferase